MKKVAYLGDTSLPGPANYLAGILTREKLPFIYVPSEQKPPRGIFTDDVGLYILSDYMSSMFSPKDMDKLCARVKNGAGLLMLGGWESYHGLGGDYDQTPLADLLPVEMSDADDRRNWSQLMLVRKIAEHEILSGLPFDTPPGIGGYNEFKARPDAKVLLEAEKCHVKIVNGKPEFSTGERVPLLVVKDGADGCGRSACLATDVAPHWVGGWVDWGDERVTVQMECDFIEVGAWYAQFFAQLVRWVLGSA